MRVCVYDHTGTGPEHQEVFEGSPEHVEIFLRRAFGFLNREVVHGDLEGCLDAIDSQQNYSVEVQQGEDELQKHDFFLKPYVEEALAKADAEDLEKMGARGDWTRDGYTIHHSRAAGSHSFVRVEARLGDKVVGELDAGHSTAYPGFARAVNITVHPQHRRRGLATAMYQRAEQVLGAKFVPGTSQTKQARALWDQEERPFGKVEADHTIGSPEVNLALEMQGLLARTDSYFDTARWMAGVEQSATLQDLRAALLKHDGDLELAALVAYGLDLTDENLHALRGLVGSGTLAKTEDQPIPPPQSIVPAHPDASETAVEVERAFAAGTFHIVQLNGKHSNGAMIGKDSKSHHLYLLKPGSGDNSPAQGVHEETASQSRREAAFWHVADMLGLGEFFPRADLLYINGNEVAAIRMLPLSFKNLGTALKQNPSLMPHVMTPYLVSGLIHKWAILDYILGNPDRHSMNLMVDDDDRTLRLIDQGSALAGRSFDPAHDENSFVPYTLRAWTGAKFHSLEPAQQLRQMPTAGIDGEKAVARWLRDIDEKKVAAKLAGYGVDADPAVERLEYVKMLPGPKDQVINGLWLGLGSPPSGK